MYNLALPREFPSIDRDIRDLVESAAKEGPITSSVTSKPEGFPTISLIMIVKNEWSTLRECVSRVLPIVDEIIIGVDKRSDEPLIFAFERAYSSRPKKEVDAFFDKFREEGKMPTNADIAKFIGVDPVGLLKECVEKSSLKPTFLAAQDCLKMVGKGKVFDLDFKNHFSNSRNQTLKEATGEWCLMLDGHELIEHVTNLFNVFSMDCSHLYQVLIGLVEEDHPSKMRVHQNRLFRRTPDAHYERGVHNQLRIPEESKDPNAQIPIALQEMLIVHLRPPFLSRFREHQRRGMILDHMGKGDDAPSLYYLGTQHVLKKQFKQAIKTFQKYLEISGPCPEAALVCNMIGGIYLNELKDQAQALLYYTKGIAQSPDAAFCYLGMANVWKQRALLDDDPIVRERFLRKALNCCRCAKACEFPSCTMALPTPPYTFESRLREAEIHRLLGNMEDEIECLSQAAMFDSDPEIKEKINEAYFSAATEYVFKKSNELRSFDKTGIRRLAIFDRWGQFNEDIREVAIELGYEVLEYREFSYEEAMKADVWWVEWADENAIMASTQYRGDRLLIVRCHSFETFTDLPGKINWNNVDIKLASAGNVFKKLEDKFALKSENFGVLTVRPNPKNFSMPEDWDAGGDVVILGRVNGKKGYDQIPLLAELLDDRTIHLGGTVQDERVYDSIVDRCFLNGIENLKIYGHISSEETESFLRKGSHYAILSPWETLSVSLQEAQLCGLQCHALNYPWVRMTEGTIAHRNIVSIAEYIRNSNSEQFVDSRVKIRDRISHLYEIGRQTIEEYLTVNWEDRKQSSLNLQR